MINLNYNQYGNLIEVSNEEAQLVRPGTSGPGITFGGYGDSKISDHHLDGLRYTYNPPMGPALTNYRDYMEEPPMANTKLAEDFRKMHNEYIDNAVRRFNEMLLGQIRIEPLRERQRPPMGRSIITELNNKLERLLQDDKRKEPSRISTEDID